MSSLPGPRSILLTVALLVRLAFAAISFGSIDLVNSIRTTPTLFRGELWDTVPYFPTLSTLLWFGGFLALETPLPLAFGYKIFPVLFDAFLAPLIYDLSAKKGDATPDSRVASLFFARAFAAGLLYALSPIAILLTCLHGQWDPIWMFLLLLAFHVRNQSTRPGHYALYGGLFAASILVKPVALVLAPFFIEPLGTSRPDRRYLVHQGGAVAGAFGAFLAAMGLFSIAGYSPLEMMQRILRYSERGVITFGLPFALPMLPFLESRLWFPAVVLGLFLFYNRGRIPILETVLVVFCIWIGLSGLSPQYLIWPVPFLLASRRFGLAAAYHVPVIGFLLLYYMGPSYSYFPHENMATFATLHSWTWLMPTAHFSDPAFAPLVRLLGNCLIPGQCLGIAFWVLRDQWKETAPRSHLFGPGSPTGVWPGYFLPILATVVVVGLVHLVPDGSDLAARFSPDFVRERIQEYRIDPDGPNHYPVGIYDRASPFNFIVILGLGTLAWAGGAVWASSKTTEDTENTEKTQSKVSG